MSMGCGVRERKIHVLEKKSHQRRVVIGVGASITHQSATTRSQNACTAKRRDTWPEYAERQHQTKQNQANKSRSPRHRIDSLMMRTRLKRRMRLTPCMQSGGRRQSHT